MIPIPIIIGFITKFIPFKGFDFSAIPWKFVLLVVAIIAVCVTGWVFMNKLEKKNIIIADQKQVIFVLENSNKELIGALEQQNIQITRWKTRSDELQDDLNTVADELKDAKTNNQGKVRRIIEYRTPANCKEAIEFLKNQQGELQWAR